MTYSTLFKELETVVGNYDYITDAVEAGENGSKTIFIIHFADRVEIRKPRCQFSFFVEIDIALLNEQLTTMSAFTYDTNDMIACLERKAHEIIPVLAPFNGAETDYLKLAELCHKRRGSVAAKRFGF